MQRSVMVALGLVTAMAAGCTLGDEVVDFGTDPVVDEREPVVAPVPPPPISGGTMAVLDADRVIIADSDRDRVHIVRHHHGQLTLEKSLDLSPGDEPGRVVVGAEGRAHVVLRGAAAVATLDTGAGAVIERRPICGDPRGVAHDATGNRLFVTCADGTLAELPEAPGGGTISRHDLGPDLRDVVVHPDGLKLSRFRSAEVLEVSLETFEITDVRRPLSVEGREPTAAWRLIDLGDSYVVALHQYSSTRPLPTEAPATPDDVDTPAPYGGGGNGCEDGIVTPALSVVGPDTERRINLNGIGPAVDAATHPDGSHIVVAVPGARDGENNLVVARKVDVLVCDAVRLSVPGQPVSVVMISPTELLVQSREPAHVTMVSLGDDGVGQTLVLDTSTRFDTGHDLFHRATGAGIACAGCHPEGGDDGHVWSFTTLGPRRTQPLDVGLAGSEPFHWDGDMETFQHLAEEVFTRRMGGPHQSRERAAAFERWLYSLRRPAAGAAAEPGLVAEGEALFGSMGCASCHAGTQMTNLASANVFDLSLQVPSLRRVALRPPFMHDGRASTLREAIADMVEATRPVAATPGELDALEAYLRTR